MASAMSQSKEGKVTNYFAKEKRLLKLTGVSFTGDESTAYKIYAFLLIFWTNFMYAVLASIELFKHDIEVISDMLIYLFAMYIGFAKTATVLLNRLQIGKMLDKLEEEPFAVNLERGGIQEEALNKNCVWITNLQTKLYWIACYWTAFGSIIYTLIIRIRSSNYEDWKLPFGPMTILNITHSPNFEITWIYQNTSILLVVAHFATVDLLVAAVLAHLNCQFQMLQNCIRLIATKCYLDMQQSNGSIVHYLQTKAEGYDSSIDGSTIPWKYLQKHLKAAIEYHLEILELGRGMEQVFSKLLLTIFLGTLGLLCFSVYRLSVVKNNMEMFMHLSEIISGCFQVVLVCYWGEQVVFESQQVGRAAYEANIVGADLRFQKSLAFIIRRSQNCTKLTAGKFADICLITFVWIIRTSYSAFMVVSRNSSKRV